MKCEKCGANLEIEMQYCPFCGEPNHSAKQHRADMEKYEKRFRKTEREVAEQSHRFISKSVKITVIAVLAVIIFIEGIVAGKAPREIERSRAIKDLTRNGDVYETRLIELEKDHDWEAFKAYAEVHGLDSYAFYVKRFMEYRRMYNSINDYCSLRYNLLNNYEVTRSSRSGYGSLSFRSEVYGLEDFYDNYAGAAKKLATEEYESNTELHEDAMEALNTEINALLITYGGLTKEEAEEIWDYSAQRKEELLEEALKRVVEEDDEE